MMLNRAVSEHKVVEGILNSSVRIEQMHSVSMMVAVAISFHRMLARPMLPSSWPNEALFLWPYHNSRGTEIIEISRRRLPVQTSTLWVLALALVNKTPMATEIVVHLPSHLAMTILLQDAPLLQPRTTMQPQHGCIECLDKLRTSLQKLVDQPSTFCY